jgi:hypothetical protein
MAQNGSLAATTCGAVVVDAAEVAALATGGVDRAQPRERRTARVKAEAAVLRTVRSKDMTKASRNRPWP